MKIEEYLEDLRVRQARVRPHGTPSDVVYPLGEISVPDHVAHWARLRPDRAAVVFEGRTVSYRELDELSRRVAGRLASEGVGAGDRVAVHLPNSPSSIRSAPRSSASQTSGSGGAGRPPRAPIPSCGGPRTA
ncbi:AMP-binding protein [Streptomyces sp. NPDC055144]